MVLIILLILTIVFALGYLNYQNRSEKYPGAPILPFSKTDGYLTNQQIREKFDCDRLTLDARATDIFCGWPKLYNNPSSFTKANLYEYIGCEEVLKSEPAPNGGVIEERREICKDGNKLDAERNKFIQDIRGFKEGRPLQYLGL